MIDVIVLTAEEAEKVRGFSPSKAGHVLNPIPLKDGRFYLGLGVIDDPAHADVRGVLAGLPRAAIDTLPTYGPDDVQAEEPVEVARLSVRTFYADAVGRGSEPSKKATKLA